ncbi:hypothetical protein TNCV_609541 [Trichonephila clavipes]|nr:hypothetical protein TNCV_609541 [Trichonephila clavipes]
MGHDRASQKKPAGDVRAAGCRPGLGPGLPTPSAGPAPGLALHTTVTGKCPGSPEDEQEKQGKNRDRFIHSVSSVIEQRPLAACKEKRQCMCNNHSERLCTE